MKSTSIRVSLSTGLSAALVIITYSQLLEGLALLNVPKDVLFVAGAISIVVMPLAMYFGLRRLRYFKSRKLRWFESVVVGMLMAFTTALMLVLAQAILTAAGLGNHESVTEYFVSHAPWRTLSWYAVLGLAYSVVLHFVIHIQFKKHER